MVKVTLLGAGSGFTQPLFTDILQIEGLDSGVIGLVDIDAKRLEVSVKLMEKLIELLGKKDWRVEASVDRADVLKGTDYLINTIEVSGTQCVRHDNDIPLKYGIDQCIGDTIGPGGIMKALRTMPVFLDILRDAKRMCPNALIMNYTNPMSIITLGAVRTTDQPIVGLCHSVQGSSRHLANVAGVPYDEVTWKCGGINHLAWFTEFSHKGKDLYPVLQAAIQDKETYELDPVRFETMKHFGYFVTESSGHFSEYVPYYRKRTDLIERYCRDDFLGGSGFYANKWPIWRKNADKGRMEMARGKAKMPLTRSHEYASTIIDAHLHDNPSVIYGSVPNTRLIPNLSETGVVEVAVLVDKRGYTPTYFGPLPEQLAALCRSHMAVYELCVSGILNKDRESIIHAMMLDPLSAAVCSPEEIRSMAEELLKAEKKFIPEWCQYKKKAAKPARKPKQKAKKDALEEVSTMASRK